MRYTSIKAKVRQRMAGFTIVEIVVVMAIGSIMAGVLFGPLNSLYNDNIRSLRNVTKIAEARGALRFMENNTSLAYAFEDSITDHRGTAWSWTGTSATNRVFITKNYATTIDANADPNGNRTMLFTGGSCTTPVLNTYIYFVTSGTLYRRTVKDTATPCFGTNAQKQTCPAGTTAAGCQGNDAILLKNVTAFTVDYYATSRSTSVMANQYTSASVPSTAKAVVLTVTARSGTGGVDTTTTNSIRVARVNGP